MAELNLQHTVPVPPAGLPHSARHAWRRLHDFHRRRGTWHDMYLLDMGAVAHACGWYVDAARAVRALATGQAAHPDAERALETGRRRARIGLVDWGWLPPERLHVGAIDADGLDADLAALCAPLT